MQGGTAHRAILTVCAGTRHYLLKLCITLDWGRNPVHFGIIMGRIYSRFAEQEDHDVRMFIHLVYITHFYTLSFEIRPRMKTPRDENRGVEADHDQIATASVARREVLVCEPDWRGQPHPRRDPRCRFQASFGSTVFGFFKRLFFIGGSGR